MSSLLFAYGTLQHPLIITQVIGRLPEAFPALLKDFARYTVRGEDFPGILPKAGSETDGTVFTAITPEEWEKLDLYESDFYHRLPVQLHGPDLNALSAEAYVVPPENEHVLSREPWDLQHYTPFT